MNDRSRPKAAPETLGRRSATSLPPHEPSAWLRARVAERVARVRRLGLDPDATDPLIVAPLGRSGVPGEKSDRECDRCEAYVPQGPLFFTMAIRAAAGLVLITGMCTPCARLEGWVE